ncbi:stage II sporulation protein P [Clostridium omnivorum]|uniref:Stage II sporulation protein P n=1 Tax=Clostridium omnivorum TaxID=1604902 RepID=A0ABQ5NAF7_9CLOT|nr:stage II sporulation protein P [Clostridium sp. E14]GLC32234.1 stage II sporulation protein P [Clostridium sp. E14]
MDNISLKGYKLKKYISVLIFIVLISIVIPSIVKAAEESNRRNMFYIQLINYTMPLVKTTSFDEDDMAENQFSIKAVVLSYLGIDIHSPMSILQKEISYLNTEEKATPSKGLVDFALNPFKLNENQISTGTTPANNEKSNEGNLNLPDNQVTMYDPKLKQNLNVAKPDVFIYHTHTSESYSPGASDNEDQTKNVCAVGDALADELEKNYGISVAHDKTVHDVVYNNSYARSAETVDKYMKKYGDFKVVIDLHRDSIENKKTETIKLNGVNTAKFMFVMSKGNPHSSKNWAVANKMVDISNKLFPGLCKGIYPYNNGIRYFNQGKSNNAVLIEVGSDVNTTEEAKNTSKYIARIIAEYINSKN